jgi:hypothetical protein
VFLDSDDKWSEDAFERVRDFFSEHADEIDMVSCRISFFGAKEGRHITDDKYKGDRIVDVREKFWMINTTIGNMFIKAEAIRDLRFDGALAVNEDVLFLTGALIGNPRYGALQNAVFWYRRREDEKALTSVKNDLQKYFPQLRALLDKLSGMESQAGDAAKFVAYTRAYFILWLVKNKTGGAFVSDEDAGEYESYIATQLETIDPEQLYRHHRSVHAAYKAYLYHLKYGRDVLKSAELRDSKLYYDGSVVYNFSLPNRVVFRSVRRERGRYLLDGDTDISIAGIENTIRAVPGVPQSGAENDDEGYPVTVRRDPGLDRYASLGKKVMDGVSVHVSLPSKNGTGLALMATYAGEPVPLGFRIDGGEKKKNNNGREYFEYDDCLVIYGDTGATLFRKDYIGRRRINSL